MSGAAADIVMACCRDESDIIASFIDFYLDQGFDWVCLVDNGSTDDTVARILGHPRAGAVRLHADSRPGYDMRLLEYLRVFEGLATRWIFFVDVDEFVALPGGVKRFAAGLPPDATVLELPTVEMIPEPGRDPLASRRRDGSETDEIKVVWRVGTATAVSCGKHAIAGDRLVRHRDGRVFIRHYHTRSESQFRRKLHNRIQTEAAIQAVPGAADALSAFSRDARAAWLSESRELLEAGGWQRELERLAALPAVEDTVVSDWYEARDRSRT